MDDATTRHPTRRAAADAGGHPGVAVDCQSNVNQIADVDDYDERPVESAQELEELVRLREELSWTEWKAHPRFKRDRLIREGQRRFGTVPVRAR